MVRRGRGERTKVSIGDIEKKFDELQEALDKNRQAMQILAKGKKKSHRVSIYSMPAIERSLKCLEDFPAKILDAIINK